MKPLPTEAEILAAAAAELERAGRVALAQIVRTEGSTPGKAGWRLLVPPAGLAVGNLGGGAFEALVERDARELLGQAAPQAEVKRYYLTETAVRGQPTGMVCGGLAEVFLEVLMARPVLVICGGGPVGQALAANAALVGFELVVADDRDEFRRPELFPERAAIAEVERDFAAPFLAPYAGRELYAAVVTRCWETDLAALDSILRQEPPGLRYLGLLGSRRKAERVISELAERGLDAPAAGLKSPMGLDIGGETPAEIAVSILAEVLEVKHRGRLGAAAEPERRRASG